MSDESLFKLNQRYCCDPFKVHKKKVSRGLREVTAELAATASIKLIPGQKLCRTCRGKCLTSSIDSDTTSSDSAHHDQPGHSGEYEMEVMAYDELEQLNQSVLSSIGESPVSKRKLQRSDRYRKQKARKIQKSVSKVLQVVSSCEQSISITEEEKQDSDGAEMIEQLKEKFKNCTKKSEKVQVLTVLPQSWSIRKVVNEFNAPNYMVRKAKNLVKEKGVLSIPNPRSGSFPKETATEVMAFYKCEDISRVMPGKKDCVSVVKDGKRVLEQKYLVLCNLKEAYQKFKKTFPEKKLAFPSLQHSDPRNVSWLVPVEHTLFVYALYIKM